MTGYDPFDEAFAAPAPEPEPVAPRGPSRRERRVKKATHRRWITIGVWSVIAILVALVVSDTFRAPWTARPVLGASEGEPTQSSTKRGSSVRTLTATTPMRLWIAGDSLAYATGQSLGKTTGATGVVKPVYDARVSSGLTSPTFFNWPDHATKEIKRLDPESIVFNIGTNDAGVVNGKDWETTYGKQVDDMMTILAGANGERHVYWIGPPTFRDKSRNEAAKKIGDLMRERAKSHRNVTFIDGYTVFGDSKGKYQDRLPDDNGKLQLVRADDGVHFTAAGGDRLGDAIYKVLDAQWNIEAQAVPGAVKTVEETDGCCRSPGGVQDNQWRTGQSPATTAPKKTTATTTTTAAKSTTSTSSATTTTTRAASSSSTPPTT